MATWKAGGFQIVQYAYDHSPAHVHVFLDPNPFHTNRAARRAGLLHLLDSIDPADNRAPLCSNATGFRLRGKPRGAFP